MHPAQVLRRSLIVRGIEGAAGRYTLSANHLPRRNIITLKDHIVCPPFILIRVTSKLTYICSSIFPKPPRRAPVETASSDLLAMRH